MCFLSRIVLPRCNSHHDPKWWIMDDHLFPIGFTLDSIRRAQSPSNIPEPKGLISSLQASRVPELKDLMHLQVSDWNRLGLALNLDSYDLDIIEKDPEEIQDNRHSRCLNTGWSLNQMLHTSSSLNHSMKLEIQQLPTPYARSMVSGYKFISFLATSIYATF